MKNRVSFEAARKMGLGHLLKTTDIPEEKKRKSKYGNTVVETDDMKFDSKKEERHYRKLKVMERAGLIKDLQHHVLFSVAEKVYYPSIGKHKRETTYEADFTYIRDGKLIVEDVKSDATITPLYVLKKQLMMEKHGIEVMEV